MASASGLALLAGGPAVAGGPATFRSLNQAIATQAAALSAQGTKAAQQAATGVANLQTAASRLLSLQQALKQAATDASSAGGSVPNGLTVGGLQPAVGYNTPGSTVWQGVSTAQPVTQSSAGGITTVTINQASAQAILNWQTFNIGVNTHVTFNQSAGGAAASTWSVLNRITDPSAAPTEIFGAITAQGQVFVLNLNGVLFSPTAQVSLHSLVAGAVGMTDQQFLTNGIYSATAQGANVPTPSFSAANGVVDVSQGAQIITTAPASVNSGGGSVILLGAGAINSGTIETPNGQTILAAGQSFTLLPGYSVAQTPTGTITGNTQSTVLGSEIATTGPGTVINRGIITSPEGDITMAGQTVDQAGVLMSATSVATEGTIHLLTNLTTQTSSNGTTTTVANTGGTVTLEPGSVTEILPDSSSTTALNATQEAGYLVQSAYGTATQLPNEAPLPDQPGLSRIEITSGGLVTFAANSLTLAPAGQIAVDTAGRVFAGSTAQLDVSGLTNVGVPMAANQLAISVEPENLRESPLNNSVSGVLNSATAYVDIRQLVTVAATLADPSVRDYTAGGLLEVSGELGNVGHTESEWSTLGGTIYLYANEVVSQPGAVFNIAGGSEQYASGTIQQSYVIGPDSVLYNVNTAPANYAYSGVYAGETFSQPRWHISDTYESKLDAPSQLYVPGYTVGMAAGSLVLSTPTALLAGSILGGTVAGEYQVQAPNASITDPFLQSQASVPTAGTLALGDFAPNASTPQVFPTRVVIDAVGSTLAAETPASSILPPDEVDTAAFSAAQIDGLGGLSISVGDVISSTGQIPSITVEAPLTLAPGAHVTLAAPVLDIKADISAPAGSITLETVNTAANAAETSVTVAQGVALGTSGLFTNALIDPATISNAAFTNGGTVTIQSNGALDLAAASSIDTSAGAAITHAGFAGGAGGSVSITADDPTVNAPTTIDPVTMDATITSYGVTSSGTLSLLVPQVIIAPYGVAHSLTAIELQPDFFDRGFTDYVVNGFSTPSLGTATANAASAASVIVEPGTKIDAQVPVLIESPTGSTAPSGAPGQGLVLYLPPEYLFDPTRDTVTQRTGVSLTLASFTTPNVTLGTGGPVLVSQGASITVDQGQGVTLESYGQVTEDGAIAAPAGRISLLNLSTLQYVSAEQSAQISVWVGPHAVLDAAAVAETEIDTHGHVFGVVPGGGTITVGGVGNFTDPGSASAPEAFVFVRPGAVVDASGTAATIDVIEAQASLGEAASATDAAPVQDASAGGTISFVSASGIYLDGIFLARAGGATAAGGTLRIQLDTEQYNNAPGFTNPAWTLTPHRILVSQATQPSPLSASLQPEEASFLDTPGVAGQADISQQQITAGGFGSVDLFARDQIAFDGDVSLHASQSITLQDYTTSETSLSGQVAVSAPYVLLAGAPIETANGPGSVYGVTPLLSQGAGGQTFSKQYQPCVTGLADCTGATLKVTASLIDLENDLRFGAHSTPSGQTASVPQVIDVPGFNDITLQSDGDIRFAATSNSSTTTTNPLNGLTLAEDTLETSGNLTLQAARIYPGTGVSAKVVAGDNAYGVAGDFAATTLTILPLSGEAGAEGAPPAAPLSAFGSLSFNAGAGSIEQAGYLAAPLGVILFSADQVTLAPDSTTTVSAAGLTIPFGGTTDGVNYTYAGQILSFQPASYGALTQGGDSNQGVGFDAQTIVVRQNAVIDVSGGGTLAGGGGEVLENVLSSGATATVPTYVSQGFISGSGGSTDALITSLITFNANSGTATQKIASATTTSGTGIYAILPTSGLTYAPTTQLDADPNVVGSEPAVGERITVGAGVPGLAPGSYTLLPSYYALLPGAYRVQFSQGTQNAVQLAATSPDTLSYDVSGYLGVSNTGIQSTVPTTLLITPGANVLRYAQYDQQSYSAFAVAQAAVFDTPRPYLPEDAGVVDFTFAAPTISGTGTIQPDQLALQFQGVVKFSPATGGYDGAVGIDNDAFGPTSNPDPNLEILGPGEKPVAGAVSIDAQTIDALHAPLLEIGGYFGSNLASTGDLEFANPQATSVIVNPGATLTAGAVWLFANNQIVISPGSTINTLGRAVNLPDSSTGVVFVGGGGGSGGTLNTSVASATVGVANGTYVGYSAATGSGNVVIGTENAGGATYNPATLTSENFIGIFGGGNISIASTAKIGTAEFDISVPEINVGAVPANAGSAIGYNLTQTAIDQLIAGGAATGAPALQTLQLGATQSLNFFGTVNFGTAAQSGTASTFQTLVLSTPAIYGLGGASDIASINVANLVWNGSIAPAGPVVAGGPGTGAGTLQINAQTITLGYPAQAQAQDQTTQDRLILGFANVDLSATSYISANNNSTLAVYQSESAYVPGTGSGFSGGNLNLATPLLTSAPGAVLSVTAGGAIDLAAAATTATGTTTVPTGLGGAISLTGASITDATDTVLPGGSLALNASGNIALNAGTSIDLGGRTEDFFSDQQSFFGGTLSVETSGGNVTLDPAASINISAPGNAAGAINIMANSGTVSLAGTITGTAATGANAGSIDISAANIANLTALNTALDAGGVSYARSFEQTGPGNITIGNEIVAQNVSVSADQGSLTVTGTINASGAAPGTISLAAADGITLASTAVLDAHGTVLQTDSTGAPIAAENTASVALTVNTGTLTIDPGASFNLASPDGVARGDLELNVPRGTTLGDANISVSGSIAISGAGTIAVNAFRTYTPSSGPFAGGVITQAALDTVNADSTAFINAAVANGALTGPLVANLAGLSAYASVFHLRPGVAIESDSTSGGNLTIDGDIDLAGYRYASVNPNTVLNPAMAGSGEPGVLWLRASGNLFVFGSVTDGFAAPPATPDDNGWVLQSGVSPTGQNLVVSTAVTLAGQGGPNGATTFPVADYTLNYAVTLENGALLAAGSPAPAALSIVSSANGGNTTVPNTFVLNGTLTLANGTVLAPGQTVQTGTNLLGATMAPGTLLPFQVAVAGAGGAAGIAMAAGTNFGIFADTSETLQSNVTLAAGDVIPALAKTEFPVAGETSVNTRPQETVDGASVQGQIFAVAPMLPAGDLSWSLRLVSGANLGAADSSAVLPSLVLAATATGQNPTPGSLVLSDQHFADQSSASGTATTGTIGTVADFSVLRTGTGYLDLVSGGSITESTLFGVYTAGTQSAGIVAGGAYDQARPGGASPLGSAGDLAGANGATYNAASSGYQANYPTDGGNLVVSAQQNIVGNTYSPGSGIFDAAGNSVDLTSDATNQFIWWQGSATVPAAWWINFGSFVTETSRSGATVYLTGFTGFGTLGGGNATISAGNNIGILPGANGLNPNSPAGTVGTTGAVSVTVASTGQVDPATGAVTLTGGGTLTVAAGNAINPSVVQSVSDANDELNGTIADLRGNITIRAGSVGQVTQTYTPLGALDPRPENPFVSESFDAAGGPVLSLGDGAASQLTRGDQDLSGVGDPTAGAPGSQFALSGETTQVNTVFSLWQNTTSVTLDSLGGNVVPIRTGNSGSNDVGFTDFGASNPNTLYPPTLSVTAFSGNIDLERSVAESASPVALELYPSTSGQLQMLAGGSIYDVSDTLNGLAFGQVSVDISGASPAGLPTPQAPGYTQGAVAPAIFATDPDFATGLLHQGDTTPARFYAVSGDILGLQTGQSLSGTVTGQVTQQTSGDIAATAVQVHAGNDVVGFTGIVLNNNAADISTIQAGRDIIYANEQIAGPGLLQVEAGRNLYQGDQGSLTSDGEIGQALTVSTRDDGAGITVIAGVGATGPALSAFADLYLNPANLADPNTPLQDQPGKVERTYQAQLLTFLQTRFGYTGTASGALAAFLALPQEQQTAFLLTVYFDELNQSGLDYNNPASRFYHSYLEGEEAITALFPGTDLTGKSPPSGGSITLFSGTAGDSGIHTLFGGGITTVVPFGTTSLGNYGFVPGAGAGLVTEGNGNINMYSYGSVELGQSRVLTTFGGNILIWMSSNGEINAGRGSKSTVISTPIGISYDNYGNVTLSPTVPSSGAGIGTISPIPEVAPGDVNLIAPVGTVNAGEAGIRASGNANIAALTLVNGANIQVSGKTTGVPTVTAPSAAAEAAGSAASGAAANAAQQAGRPAPAPEPSIIEVEVISVTGGTSDEEQRKRRKRNGGA